MVNDFNINRMNPYQVNQYVNRLVGGLETGAQGAPRNIVNKNPLNVLYNQPQVDIAKQIQPAAKAGSKVGLKTIAKYAPITGDIYDIYSGGKKVLEGHPYVGLAQMGLGGLGLATLGAGSVVKSAAKAGVKGVARKALTNTLKATAKNPYKTRVLPSVALELAYGNGGNDNKVGASDNVPTDSQLEQLEVIDDSQLPLGNAQIGNYPSIEQIIASAGGRGQVPMGDYEDLRGMEIAQLQDIASQPNQQPVGDIASLLQAYQTQQQGLQQPYIDALQNYLDNYGEYTKGSRNAQRFYTALAGLSGNAGYKDLAKQYDPMQLELNRINLVKALQDAKAGNVGNINEIIGNATIAQAMGLDPQAALANKNLLNAFTAQQKAQYGLQGKMYGADQAYNARVYDTNIDNATRLALQQGRTDLALKLQGMKGNTSTTNALINAASFGADPSQVQAMLDYFGGGTSSAKGLTRQGTAQHTKKQGATVESLF